MERQHDLEKTCGLECGGKSGNGSELDIASTGAGQVGSESSLDSGDGSSLSGLSCTPQSSTESPQVDSARIPLMISTLSGYQHR